MLKIVEPLGGFADLYKKGPRGRIMASGRPVVAATRFRDDGWVLWAGPDHQVLSLLVPELSPEPGVADAPLGRPGLAPDDPYPPDDA